MKSPSWRRTVPRAALAALAALAASAAQSLPAVGRPIEIQTTRVTGADLALSPDGRTVIFTLLGHLFSVPAGGGTAEQLTFGPSYESDPVFSPDGSRVAFISDRDGSEGNIFLLGLADRTLVQLTREESAGRPVFSPEGAAIAYLRYGRSAPGEQPVTVSRIAVQGGQPESLHTARGRIGSLFYLSGGRLAWSAIERNPATSEAVTRIESAGPDGRAAVLRTIAGGVEQVVVSPAGDGVYGLRVLGSRWVPLAEDLVFAPLGEGAERSLLPSSAHGRLAIAADGKSLVLGDEGRLWRVALPAGDRRDVPFRAGARLELAEVTMPPPASLHEGGQARAILSPRLSPDGRTLVFGAAGFLWRQELAGGPARRISQGDALEGEPAISPDGRWLAFVRTEHGRDSLVLLDLLARDAVGGRPRAIESMSGVGAGSGISEVDWSRDGRRLVATVSAGFGGEVVAIDAVDGKRRHLADFGSWSPRAQLARDGGAVYYSADDNGIGNFYRLALVKDAKPEPITRLSRHLSAGRMTPDGKWLVFRRNRSILLASLARLPVQDADVRQLSDEGGDAFELTPDGSAVVYAAGGKVWRQPLAGGAVAAPPVASRGTPGWSRREIPLRLRPLLPGLPPPLLVRHVRALDLAAGAFGPEASLLVEQGRVRWIGDERGHELPPGTVVVDAAGCFAIPGLFDLHVHSAGAGEGIFLAYGVTSLRDTGGPLAWLAAMRDRSEWTDEALPRTFYSGEIFEGEHPYWGDGFLQIGDEREARDYVGRFQRQGAAFIKVYPSLDWRLKRAVVQEAHRLGLPVVGHGTSTEEIVKSVTLGFFSLEHTMSPDRPYDDLLQLLAASGTRWDPTVVVSGAAALLLRDEPELLSDAKFRALTPESFLDFARSSGYYRRASSDTLRGRLAGALAAIARGHRLGVTLLTGTDAPNPEVFYGVSLHWELARLVEAGLSPIEVLRLATAGGAAAVGAADLGAIAPGKAADLVLLRANPLQDIHNTAAIWRVIKGGRMFDPEKLQAAGARARRGSAPAGRG